MPARVNNPRAADELRREYSVSGDRINLQVDDVVVPVAIVADLSSGSGGVPVVRRAYGTFYQGLIALEYPVWRLEVPPGFVAIVNRILVRTTSTDYYRVHFGSTFPAPATIANKQMMDGRLRAQGIAPAVTLAHNTQVAPLATPYRYMQCGPAPGVEAVVEWPFGREDAIDFIEFQGPVVAEAITVSIEWDEIALW